MAPRNSLHDPETHRPKVGPGSLASCEYCIRSKKGCYYPKGLFTCGTCSLRKSGPLCSTQVAQDTATGNAASVPVGLAGAGIYQAPDQGGRSAGSLSSASGVDRASGEDRVNRKAENLGLDERSVPEGADNGDASIERLAYVGRLESQQDIMSENRNLSAQGGSGGNLNEDRGQGQAGSSSGGPIGQIPSIAEQHPLNFGAGSERIPRVAPENQLKQVDRPPITCCGWCILDKPREGRTQRFQEFEKFYAHICAKYPDACLRGQKYKHKDGDKVVYERFKFLFIVQPSSGDHAPRVFGTDDLAAGEITELALRDHVKICFEEDLAEKSAKQAFLVQYLTFYSGCSVPYDGHFKELRISLTKYRAAGQEYASVLDPLRPKDHSFLSGPAHPAAPELEELDFDAHLRPYTSANVFQDFASTQAQGSQRTFGPAPPPGLSGKMRGDPFMGAPQLGDEDADFKQFKSSGFKGAGSTGSQSSSRPFGSAPPSGSSGHDNGIASQVTDDNFDPGFDDFMNDLFPQLKTDKPHVPPRRYNPPSARGSLGRPGDDDTPAECKTQ